MTRPGAPPLREVAVVGTGVMGTSVALALRRHGVRVFLSDRDREAVQTASRLGAGTAGPPAGMVDLAVLAVPPSSIAEVLAEQQGRGLAKAYTDVAGVKSEPLAEAEALGCDLTRFIGGHPIAGSERSGPAAASDALFLDRAWVLTPHAAVAADVVAAATTLVTLCGARCVTLEPAEHDRIVARTSHVPHVVSSALAATLFGANETVLRLCGPGVRDATRIAAGNSVLWTDILRSNATEVAKLLAQIADDLSTAADALMTDTEQLTTLLNRGNAGRAALLTDRPAGSH